jgi:competence protein ComFB
VKIFSKCIEIGGSWMNKVVHNVMEEYVQQTLNEVWDSLDCCKCDQCKTDIMSLALNQLKPHYVSTELGKAFVKVNTMSSQFEIDILTAIYEAAKIVKENPRHGKKQAK